MNCYKSLTAAWVCILFSRLVFAQDKICLENEVRQGKVADISLSTVKYTLLDKPDQPLLLPLHRVLILFNSDGDYLVPSQMDSTNPKIRSFLSRFFAPGAHPRTTDQVFSLQHTLLEVKITREDADNIYWGDNGRFFKKDIAAIIYADGRSKIFCPMNQAAQILGACQRTPLNLGIGSDVVANNTGSPAESAPATSTESVKSIENTTGNSQDSLTQKRVATLLGEVSRKEFEEKAEKKTAQFTDYLKILCDKSAGYEALDKAISQAVSLFVNEDAMVEISSNNRNSILRLKIRDYLRKVKQVQYDRIDVKWTHVQYVSDLKPGPDGNLYGTVSFEQEFRGYRDGKLVYSDVTLKHANVVLKTYNKTYEGSNRKIWDVLLSDVGVVATKSM
ncbi:hypothetical protein [Puia sp.]|jgi:hypothetical protein|uniref:hypothetical protein n=1 Tax=Puia sp. TaxID=2045100 RepID=UPI002F3F7C2E